MPGVMNPSPEAQASPLGSTITPAAGQVIASLGTIALPTAGSTVRVTPAGAVTGVIMAQGLYDGQIIVIVNTSTGASSVTFATAATSFVADGTSSVIAGLNSAIFVWDSVATRWSKVKA